MKYLLVNENEKKNPLKNNEKINKVFKNRLEKKNLEV